MYQLIAVVAFDHSKMSTNKKKSFDKLDVDLCVYDLKLAVMLKYTHTDSSYYAVAA